MICPNCQGGKIHHAVHPVSIPCSICNGTGELPENIKYDLAKGAELKRNRIDDHRLTLREYCIRYHLSAVIRSEEERGFFRGKPVGRAQ